MTEPRQFSPFSQRSLRFPRFWLAWILALAGTATVLVSCSTPQTSTPETATSPTATAPENPTSETLANTEPQAALEKIKFKQADGNEAFSLKFKPDGAKLVDAADAEMARLTVDGAQKVKIKDASDQVLGYVVSSGDHWKLENADQTQELYILRRQSDGDYKLEDGQDTQIYRIKQRDYGYEIESPDDQSLYKIKVKEGKTSLRNAQDDTVLSTKDAIAPIAMACFGFDVLTPEQQAALALAMNSVGD